MGYGSYVPRYRLKAAEIARAHGAASDQVERSLLVGEKSVANWDEDSATMAYMASARALSMAGFAPIKIGAVYVGSESHPYAVKPTSTIVGEALGVGHDYMAADLEFACKAGTAAIQIVAGQIISGVIDYGLAVGTDCAQARPGDALEYTAASGAAGFILGRRGLLASLDGFVSYSSDINDFWRRSGEQYPSHAGRFTGEPAYFRHVVAATERFFKASSTHPSDYAYVVFHMPNGKFPRRAAEKLGFQKRQYGPAMVVSEIGNPYSASALLGLCQVLDRAAAGERILATAYGSGAGADTLAFTTTPLLVEERKRAGSFSAFSPVYLSYGEYRVLHDDIS